MRIVKLEVQNPACTGMREYIECNLSEEDANSLLMIASDMLSAKLSGVAKSPFMSIEEALHSSSPSEYMDECKPLMPVSSIIIHDTATHTAITEEFNNLEDDTEGYFPECPGDEEQIFRDYNPFARNNYYHNSRLVASKCDYCGKVTIRRLSLQEDNSCHCHWCKAVNIINTVTRVDIKCSSCNTGYYIWTANSLSEINCKDCDSPIDIEYWNGGKKGASVTLVPEKKN